MNLPNKESTASQTGSALGGSGVSQLAGEISHPLKPLIEPLVGDLHSSGGGTTGAGSNAPSAEEISERAWILYTNAGCPEGRSLEHWLQAERELTSGG